MAGTITRAIRHVLLALLTSLLVGLAIGTLIRLRMDRPVLYFVEASQSAAPVGAVPERSRARADLV